MTTGQEPPCADVPLPEVSEFAVTRGEDGMFHGRHLTTGERIQGETAQELQHAGIVARVRSALTDPRDRRV